MVSKRLVIAKNVKINGTWEKRSPKPQWTTFWMETLNKSVVQVPNYQETPKKIGTEGP